MDWALNKVTIKNKYLVPSDTDLFDRFSKASYLPRWTCGLSIGKSGLQHVMSQK